VMLTFNFRANVLEVVQVFWRCLVSHFCDFCKPVIFHPVYMISS
jgi:hypothetical protein